MRCCATKNVELKLGQQCFCPILNFNKMNKIMLIIFTVSLNMLLFSCTSEDLEDGISIDKTEDVATGGEDGQTPIEEEDNG